ncbi:MAG: MFS transporter [Candidatus Moranbacteria bacterium]|nr:MFS transporter [Candidatus Moranbacteria bacterium]
MHHRFHLHIHRPKYFQGRISRGYAALFTSRTITDIASGLFAVFLPIFLYLLLGESLKGVILYYLASYVLYLFIIFFFVKDLDRLTYHRALRMSALLGAAFYFSLFFATENNLFYILPFSVVLVALWRFFYWIPYEVDVVKVTSKKDRAKQLGLMEAAFGVTSIATPFIAGYVIESFGFNALFLIGVIVFLLSSASFAFIPEIKEKFSWSKKKLLRKIVSPENRQASLIFFADGAEAVVHFLIWPIFVFLVLKGDYLKIGSVTTMVVSATVIMQLLAGRFIDGDGNKQKMVKWGGLLYSLGWIAKIFILTAFHIFVVDAFHRLTQIFYRTPLDVFTCDKAGEQKHLVDEFVVFREICLCLGRIFMLSVIFFFSFFAGVQWIFIFGALFSLFLSLIYSKLHCSLR